MSTCFFCGDSIDQKTVLCMADDISHAICRAAGKAVSKEERDADAARIAKLRTLPWVAFRRRDGGWSTATWIGTTRGVVLVGCDTPYGIPPEAVVYEVSAGKTAEQVADESGGIIVTIFDNYPRGEEWKSNSAPPGSYSSGVKYRQDRAGDSDTRVAAVCAELRARGVAARSYIASRTTPRGPLYHCLIRWPDGSTSEPAQPLGSNLEGGAVKNIKFDVGRVDHGDRERIVKWLRSGDGIGGDDMVAQAIADDIERGADITYERDQQIEQHLKSVARLAATNIGYLRTAPTLPRLYESGVRYDAALDGESLCDVASILADPSDLRADVESLVAWRCAELWQRGIQAAPYIKWRDREGGERIYTMVVRWPDGSKEDVVALLGDDRRGRKEL